MYHTYIHRRKTDHKIFYVGKGKGSRPFETRKRNVYWNKVVNKHGYYTQIMCSFLGEKESFEHEIFLISCFKQLGQPLTNMTNGGEGLSGNTKSPETREKLRIANTGKKVSEETKRKLSEINKGRPMHDNTKQALLTAIRGRTLSDASKLLIGQSAKGRNLKFIFEGTNNEGVISFVGRTELENAGWNRGNIYRAMSKNRPYQGYIWKKISALCC